MASPRHLRLNFYNQEKFEQHFGPLDKEEHAHNLGVAMEARETLDAGRETLDASQVSRLKSIADAATKRGAEECDDCRAQRPRWPSAATAQDDDGANGAVGDLEERRANRECANVQVCK